MRLPCGTDSHLRSRACGRIGETQPLTNGWRTFTILTTKPNEIVAPLHDRMPLILDPRDYDRWLDKEYDPADLIRPFPDDGMVTWPISTRVNKPENDDSAILDRVQAA
jgi:putative SOS response-associated peptidase YedK